MKYFFISILIVTACANRNVSKTTPPLQIIKATKQDWIGGVVGSTGGTNYEIVFISPDNNSNFIANDIWIGDTYYETKAIKYKWGGNRTIYNKGDTLIIAVLLAKNKEGKDLTNEQINSIKKPDGYTGEALIGYVINKQNTYVDIPKFIVLQKQL